MKKLLLLLILTVAPVTARAQFVRHTQGCGEVKANDEVVCIFGATTDTGILDGSRSGFLTLTIRPTRIASGASFCTLPYEELSTLIQTLQYAKVNPPSNGEDESTRIIFRAQNLLEFSCDIGYGKNPEAYISVSPNTPGIGAKIPWARIDEVIAVLGKCMEVLDAHCAGN